MTVRILVGDALAMLRTLDAESVQCCVTSPPYWGLRDYGVVGQLGMEKTPDEYVGKMLEVFREVRRVLRKDGTLWLNIGDSYAGGKTGRDDLREFAQSGGIANGKRPQDGQKFAGTAAKQRPVPDGLKAKDLVGIPWMLAFALRADGWYLRSDCIWSKPNPMPESVTDRPTKAHEYVFLLSKSERYYYDAEAVAEPVTASTIERLGQPTLAAQEGSSRVPGKTNGNMKAVAPRFGGSKYGDNAAAEHRTKSGNLYEIAANGKRNRRSVWTVATQPFKESHFATMPPDLAETCILAGAPAGGVVLDPFGGAGTTGLVADRLGRDAILIELNPEYAKMAERRIAGDAGMFADVDVA